MKNFSKYFGILRISLDKVAIEVQISCISSESIVSGRFDYSAAAPSVQRPTYIVYRDMPIIGFFHSANEIGVIHEIIHKVDRSVNSTRFSRMNPVIDH